jgi:predicted  nucleic acid-binding Zn-ribbon protein
MIKATEDAAQKILDRVGVLRQRLSRVERLRSLKDRKEWEDLRDLLVDLHDQHVKAVTNYVEYRTDLEPVEMVSCIRRHQGCRDAFQSVLDLVERPQEETDRLRHTIEDLEKSLDDKKAELDTFK